MRRIVSDGDTTASGYDRRTILLRQKSLGQKAEDRHGSATVLEPSLASQICQAARRARGDEPAAALAHQGAPLFIARDKPVLWPVWILDDQPGGVAVARQILQVDLAGAQQLMD